MGKVDRLLNKGESFAALFWALGIVLANTPDPACRPGISTAVHKACLCYMVIVGSILNKGALPSHLPTPI